VNRILLFFIVLSNTSAIAQEFEILQPKAAQIVGQRFNVWVSETEVQNANYRLLVDSAGILMLDSTFQTATVQVDLQSGIYGIKAYLVQQNNLIDSSKRIPIRVFSPRDIDNLSIWISADSVVLGVNDRVVEWINKSDSAIQLIQSNNNFQPIYRDSMLNALPSLYFDLVNDRFSFPIDLERPSFLISSVYNCYETSFGGMRMLEGSNNWFFGPYFGLHRAFAGVFTPGYPLDSARFLNHTLNVSNDTLKNYVNDNFIGQAVGNRRPGTSLTLGNRLNGDIAEFIIVSGVVADSNRRLIDSYLMDKYAPPISLGADRVLCAFPDTIDAFKDYLRSYSWSNGDTTSTTIIDSAGVYYLDAIDEFGRLTTDTIRYLLDMSNNPVSIDFNDTTLCAGESIAITVGPERFTYQWNTGATSNSLTIDSAGLYKVTVTNCALSSSVDSFTVNVNQPLFSLGADTTICFNQPYRIEPDSLFFNATYLWSDGDTASFYLADSTDIYSLTVLDEFNCSYTDSILITVDSNLFGLSLGADTSLCEGNSIGLQGNTTGIQSYLWGTGNTNPNQVVDTAGAYTLTASDALCVISDTISISIQGLAPTTSFSFSQLCLGDTVSFIDGSQAPIGDTIVDFLWDFATLSTDTNQNPFYSFPDTGLYAVSLKVTTDKGCEDTSIQFVDIKPLPDVEFDISGNCSNRPIQFTSNSSISKGSLQSFKWDFGDGGQSLQQNPIRPYSSFGAYNVTLIVSSDQNCVDSTSRSLFINATPAGSFDLIGTCLGDSSKFISTAQIDNGIISRYSWFVNQQVVEDSIANIFFLTSGAKEITLRTESDSACIDILRDTIDIFNSPIAQFIANDPCEGDSLRVIDDSQGQGDTIVSYSYSLSNGQTNQNSTVPDPVFDLPILGNYQLSLKVESLNGCIDSTSRLVRLNPNPTASFQILNNTSGAPMTLDVINNSQLASTYEWSSSDGQSSNLSEPAFVYQDTGSYQLTLIAISDANCRDTISQELLVFQQLLDASILDAQIIPGLANDYRIRVRLANTGNNQIDEVLLSVLPDGNSGLAENVNVNLYRGQSVTRLLNAVLIDDESKTSYVCLEIETVNGVEDERKENNRFCLSAFPDKLFLKAYPNPIADRLQIDFVLLESNQIDVSIHDATGREVRTIVKDGFYDEGFHNLTIATESLNAGVYFLRFVIDGNNNDVKLIKQ